MCQVVLCTSYCFPLYIRYETLFCVSFSTTTINNNKKKKAFDRSAVHQQQPSAPAVSKLKSATFACIICAAQCEPASLPWLLLPRTQRKMMMACQVCSSRVMRIIYIHRFQSCMDRRSIGARETNAVRESLWSGSETTVVT